MNKIIIISTIFLSFFNIAANSQLRVNQVKNTIHIDAASIYFIGMYSINYERFIHPWKSCKIYANIGLGGYYELVKTEGISFRIFDGKSAILTAVFLLGERNHHFETSLGGRYIFFDQDWEKEHASFKPEINIGYRFQRHDGRGLLFKFLAGSTGIGVGLGKAF
jgi:hypothetical protein